MNDTQFNAFYAHRDRLDVIKVTYQNDSKPYHFIATKGEFKQGDKVVVNRGTELSICNVIEVIPLTSMTQRPSFNMASPVGKLVIDASENQTNLHNFCERTRG